MLLRSLESKVNCCWNWLIITPIKISLFYFYAIPLVLHIFKVFLERYVSWTRRAWRWDPSIAWCLILMKYLVVVVSWSCFGYFSYKMELKSPKTDEGQIKILKNWNSLNIKSILKFESWLEISRIKLKIEKQNKSIKLQMKKNSRKFWERM